MSGSLAVPSDQTQVLDTSAPDKFRVWGLEFTSKVCRRPCNIVLFMHPSGMLVVKAQIHLVQHLYLTEVRTGTFARALPLCSEEIVCTLLCTLLCDQSTDPREQVY